MSILVPMDIGPTAVRQADSLSFSNVADYSEISAVTPGAAAYTSFTRYVRSTDGLRPAKSVICRFVFTPMTFDTRIRLGSYHYDSNGVKVWKDDWREFVPTSIGAPKNANFFITEQWNAYWNDPIVRAQGATFIPKVKGTGYLYQACIEIDYELP